VRHWSGLVDHSPDLGPVLGPAPEVEGFVFDCGWIYGFMGAPGASQLLARSIVEGTMDPLIAPFDVRRLHEGRLIVEAGLAVPAEPAS
jgi:sarcosine oxidase subunit beta